jgi:DNA-binding XRE family transcriptional regulator
MDVKALKKHVARTIRLHREQLGLSQAALGRVVDLSETTISRIERGEYLPTLEKIYSLSRALNKHPMTLLQGDDLSKFVEGLPRESQLELQEVLGKILAMSKTRSR